MNLTTRFWMQGLLSATLAAGAGGAAAQQAAKPPVALPPVPAAAVAANRETTSDMAPADDLTVVTSERLTYDAKQLFALFENNVVVSDPEMKLKSDKLTIRFTEKNEMTSILAEGHVVMTQADKTAWAQKATYEVASGRIVLEGEPRITRGKEILQGDKITFWRDQNRMICEPNARLVIQPEKKETRRQVPTTRGP